MGVRKYHINPQTGDVGRCFSQYDKCPFGNLGMHFYEEKAAWNAAATKLEEFHNWTSLSAVPQVEPWFTVDVINPREKHDIVHSVAGSQPGHHLVMENGWIYERAEEWRKWQALSGEMFIPTNPIEIGEVYDVWDFYDHLDRVGGRIETTPDLLPFNIPWPGSDADVVLR